MTIFALSWILTYLLHSTLLLAVAWVAWKLLPDEALAVKETLWKGALLGGLLTASLQSGLGLEPGSFGWSLGAEPLEPAVTAALVEPAGALGAATLGSRASVTTLEPAPRQGALSEASPRSSATVSGHDTSAGWPFWITAGWICGALVLTLWLATSFLLLARRLADRRPLASGRLAVLLEKLAEVSPFDRVALSASRRIASPLAFGIRRPEICLPERVAAEMSEAQQELVLAHELAHHARRDPAWLVITRLVESLFFFQPLNRLARRRLQEIAEYRCDDWAVERTGRPVTLARCLAEVAEWNLRRAGHLPVPSLAVERHRLGRRVGRLLDRAYPFPPCRRPRWLATAMIGALAAVVLLAPGVSRGQQAPPPAPPAPAAIPTPAEVAAPATVGPELPAAAPAQPLRPTGPSSTDRLVAVAPTPPASSGPPLSLVSPVPPALAVAPVDEVPEVAVPAVSVPPTAVAPVTAEVAAPAIPEVSVPPVAVAPVTAPTPVVPVVGATPRVAPTPPAAAPAPPRAVPAPAPDPESGEWVIEGESSGLVTPILDRLTAAGAIARRVNLEAFEESWAEAAVVPVGPISGEEILGVVDSALETTELARFGVLDSERLTELSRQLAELARPDPEAMVRLSRLEPEALARIGEALSGRMADWRAADPEQLARVREELRGELEKIRPQREELERIHEEIRREVRRGLEEREVALERREETRQRSERLRSEELERARERLDAERRELERFKEERQRRDRRPDEVEEDGDGPPR